MLLNELINYGDLLKMRAEGYVKEQVHPKYNDLRILNYTQSAQFDDVWNEVTERCRGLIYCSTTGEIVARPFRKFYNYGQEQAPDLSIDDEVVVMDKMDGSLGILYRIPGTWEFAIATRGSFDSDQARHATKLLNEKYGDWLKANEGALRIVTPLFEIVYPENRIVCDYKGMDDLILLGSEVLSEKDVSWDADLSKYFFEWEGPTAEIFEYETFGQALAASPRKGAEGFVVFKPSTRERVKIKQEDYIALHRIVTGLNARTVWEAAKKDCMNPGPLLESLPDEFHDWVKGVWKDLSHKVRARDLEISYAYADIFQAVLDKMGGANSREREYRKEFALAIKDHPWKSYFFLMLGDRNYIDKIWDEFKPAANIVPGSKNFSEDVA